MTQVTASPLADALRDRYTIERELGRGGMATVYLAHDLKPDRPVALKVLLPELAATQGPERFLREVQLAARLILAVGLRILVGVQYPSDALGGYAAGAVWMALCITGVHVARHRQMDREHPASVAAGEQVQPTLP